MDTLSAVFAWLLRASWQASVLVGLVLVAQWLFRQRLSPAWRYALWLLVLARLVMPASPQSPVSLFNLTRVDFSGEFLSSRTRTPEAVAHGVTTAPTAGWTAASNSTVVGAASSPTQAGAPGSKVARAPANAADGALRLAPRRSVRTWLPIVWLLGVCLLAMRMGWQNLRFARRVLRQRQVTNSEALDVLEDCKQRMGLRTPLTIIESSEVNSPALYGFVRPRLVLPPGTLAGFGRQELYYIFLHELAHVKRWDMAVNWIISGLRTLHWFNPILWFAFRRMDADREVAADAMALAHAPRAGRQLYGETIIKLLESFTRPTAIAGLVGILEDKQQMTRRITMIAQFKKMTGWSTAAAGLVLGLGLVTLTDAQTEKTAANSRIFGVSSPTVKTLLSGTGNDASGVLSPDESAVAFVDWSAKGGSLAVRDLRTGETRTVAPASEKNDSYEFALHPVWSPDSKSIAYQWYADDAVYSVRIAAREGGNPRILRRSKDEWFGPLDWSKDGKRLVGESKEGGDEAKPPLLATIELATGELRALGPEGAHARFSPDGRFVVCERMTSGNRDVFVIAVDGGQTTRVTASPVEEGCPIFSADGRLILFSSNQRGGWDLWAVRFENGRTVGVTFPVRYDFGDRHKTLTSSGKLAFRISGSGVDDVVSTDVYEIAAARSVAASEARPKAIAKSIFGRNLDPIWSPDGMQVAYVRLRGASLYHPSLCVQSLADGTEQVYESGMRRIGRMFWSPDGQSIAMRGIGEERSGGPGMYFFSLTNHTRGSDRLAAGWGIGFSADGKEFLFIDQKTKERVAVNITTKAQRKIPAPVAIPNVASLGHVTWDENVAVYVAKEGTEQQLIVADPDLKNKRVVARVQEPASIGFPSLSPDRTKVAFHVDLSGERTNHKQLHVAAADGSWDRIINTGGKYVFSGPPPSWSPDSTRFVLTLREDLPGEIGVLENFLPAEKLVTK